MAIKVYYDDVTFRLRRSKSLKEIFANIIKHHNFEVGLISFVFVDDKQILDINIEFLNHHYFTDIITFDYKDNNVINGEIYLSIETISQNAKQYAVPIKNEVLRVMIHGILHLCGLNDASEDEKIIMKFNEDKWISEFFRLYGNNGI